MCKFYSVQILARYQAPKRDICFIVFYLFNIVGQFLGIVLLTYLKILNPHTIFLAAGCCSLAGLIFILGNYKRMRTLKFSQDHADAKKDHFFDTCVMVFLFVITLYTLIQVYANGFLGSLVILALELQIGLAINKGFT